MNARAPLTALALLCAGCPSYKADLEEVCNVTARSGGVHADDSPATLARRQAAWIAEHARSKEGMAFFATLAHTGPGDRPRLLQAEATKAGVTPCPLVTEWEARNAALKAELEQVDAASKAALDQAAALRALAAQPDGGAR